MADLPDSDVRMKDTDARMKDADVRMKDADARKGPPLSSHEPLGGVTLELSDGTRCLLYYCSSYCCFTALLLLYYLSSKLLLHKLLLLYDCLNLLLLCYCSSVAALLQLQQSCNRAALYDCLELTSALLLLNCFATA